MRILLYAGKGGVGKTSVAAATGIITSRKGLKTIIISLDPAHSLSDAFDLDISLMDKNRGMPVQVASSLWIQEIDIQEEISKSWGEVYKYISILLNTSGIEDILAEELAILPGMEEVSALLYINQYARTNEYDLIILDCAPTAESIRFASMPKTLEWYMKKVFHVERKLMRYMRAVAKRMTDISLPEDEYFAGIEKLFGRLQGVDSLLTDPGTTSVRLITNPEKMVLRETQRAFMFFSLHQLCIDTVIINRVFPTGFHDAFLRMWTERQHEYLELAETYFRPVPILQAPFFEAEVLGHDKLSDLGSNLYGTKDPADVFYLRRPIEYSKEGTHNVAKIHLPFVSKQEIELTKKGEELIIRLGNFKKSIILPRTFALLEPQKAKLREDYLVVDFGGNNERS